MNEERGQLLENDDHEDVPGREFSRGRAVSPGTGQSSQHPYLKVGSFKETLKLQIYFFKSKFSEITMLV